MRWRWRMFVLFVALCCVSVAIAQSVSKQSSDHPTFIRQFSSAQDVRRTHPIVDKTLDIVAGPKEAAQVTDFLQSPRAIAADAEKRVFVLDAGSHAVHVFDFSRAKYSLLRAAHIKDRPASGFP
jgi:hypothetical protein